MNKNRNNNNGFAVVGSEHVYHAARGADYDLRTAL